MLEADASNGRGLLLVEDDETLGDLLARHLRARGYTIDVAGSAEEAISRLQHDRRPGLVLLDINLPGETGWAVLRHEAYAAADRPPVLVLSATSIGPGRLADFGIAGYLPKPFPLDTLVATIERLLTPKGGTDR